MASTNLSILTQIYFWMNLSYAYKIISVCEAAS